MIFFHTYSTSRARKTQRAFPVFSTVFTEKLAVKVVFEKFIGYTVRVFARLNSPGFALFLGAFFFFASFANSANAGALSFVGDFLASIKTGGTLEYEKVSRLNSQNMTLLAVAGNGTPPSQGNTSAITIVDETALLADTSPSQGKGVLEAPKSDRIDTYVVREDDTLSEIASMFGVSPDTIRWANDIPKNGKISPGDKLVILPVSGVRYTAKAGDTIAGIAKKYQADEEEIREFNALSEDKLAAGDSLLIPNGILPAAATPPKKPKPSGENSNFDSGSGDNSSPPSSPQNHFARPVPGKKTQGIHGHNGIDFHASIGTSVIAAASGEVVVSKASGWNGGYGSYVVIKHPNGTQTLYAHLSSVLVSSGESVSQGEEIALSGNTGRSSGPHLHFEVRGARNPF